MQHKKLILLFFLVFGIAALTSHAQDSSSANELKPLHVKKGSIFLITIPSNLGQGYQWSLFDTGRFRLVAHTFKSNPDSLASTDLEIFKLIPRRRGKYSITFYYVRPFDPVSDTIDATKHKQKIYVR